jgi:protein-S-isoprenylcysteine O-methyltransferase Ste14
MVKRLKWWVLAVGTLGSLVFALAGTWRDPWLWSYVVVHAMAMAYAMFSIDEDLARERFRPPTSSADRVALGFVRAIALGHVVVGALDSGRWHFAASVPPYLRLVGLAGVTVMFALFFTAMRQNRFFSAVIRIQNDRGHRVVDQGLYSVVRHPGYAGLLVGVPFSGLALGSWLAAAIGLVMSALILRRVRFEDAFLQQNLDGYSAYAARVRHRVIPGVW